MKVWPMAVPSDAELQQFATRILLWALLLAYFAYAALLQLTETHPAFTLFPLLCAGLHLFGLIGFYWGKTLFAAIWLTLVLLFNFTIINLFGFNDAQGPDYYFIMVPALIFMILPPQQREWQISLLTLTLALLTLCFIVPEPTEPWLLLTDRQVYVFKWFDLVLCLLYMAITCRFFIHRLLQQRNQLERLALIDTLSGLPNRHGLMQHLAGWFNEGRPFCVLLLDIDGYTDLGRRLGQDAGDQLIRKLVQRVRTDITQPLVIGRFTEHQLMLASDMDIDTDKALDLAQQVEATAGRLAFDLGGRSERIQVHIGVTLASPDELPHALLQRLTLALQQARHQTPPIQCLLAETARSNADVNTATGVQLAPPL
ncbi:GGDEF domain-containing protein [Saccharospirillum mangrovi]|uniref:GGDEF domain-containing protein n=1 Tax=Saccharospirillum mangrovi TaxID=2161747 RepID=UPI00130061F0|nr:GGDEF domain-containing protein [Saccharospirillum mangrovi]